MTEEKVWIEGCEAFEVHITGDELIPSACETLGIRSIAIDLLKPDRSILRTEHMTSFVVRFGTSQSYKDCSAFVTRVKDELECLGVNVRRTKIECPYYEKYEDQSLYIESHYEAFGNMFPISKSHHKESVFATERSYNKSEYQMFRQRHKGGEVELCLFDTNVDEDKDWFDLYAKKLCHCVGYTVVRDCPSCNGTGYVES